MPADLVDDIYEAAFFPELWPSVLSSLAEIAGARGGVLLTANPALGVLRHAASEAVRIGTDSYARDGWLFQGSRLSRLSGSKHAGFIVEHDVYTDAELDSDPTYRDFLRPRGLGWAAATAVALPTGDVVVISLEREYARGPVDAKAVAQLDALRPHLARSTLMAARLQLAGAEAAAATLDQLGLPAIVIDARGRALVVSELADAMTDPIHWRARDTVALSDPVADAQLRTALAGLVHDSSTAVRSFVVRGTTERAAMVAHLVPARHRALDLFAGAAAILVLTPVTTPAAPPVELIQSLFDLTAAEARVARRLVGGDRLDDIATSSGVSRNTVRSQLQAVLEKTGSRRQQDVIALLGGIGITRV